MLDILEKYVSHQGYSYLRMDGTTPIRKRQHLIDAFNGPVEGRQADAGKVLGCRGAI